MTEKRCFKCGETKPRDDFYRHPAMSDGLLGKCKECVKRAVRQHRLKNADKVRAYDRARARLPHRKAQRERVAERFANDNPEKRAAHVAVGNAVRDGKLEKLPCAFCGSSVGLEAHHHDYAKPLDVTWLCRPCHRRYHALERMATYERSAA